MTDLSLLQDFLAETSEHLEEMERNLLLLEDDTDNAELLDDIFRSIHTIKGSSDYLGMGRIAELSHRLENLLDLIRQGKRAADQDTVDLLIDGRDRIATLIVNLEETQAETTEIDDLLARLDAAVCLEPASAEPVEAESPEAQSTSQEKMSAIENESDAELLDIFLDQFEEGVKRLREGLEVGTQVSPELIDAALSHLNGLQSSANYMGYHSLGKVYDPWEKELRELDQQVNADAAQGPSLRAYWQNYIKPHLMTLVALIPSQTRDFQQYLLDPAFESAAEELSAEIVTEEVEADDADAQLFSDVCLDELLDESDAADCAGVQGVSSTPDAEDPELFLDLEGTFLEEETLTEETVAEPATDNQGAGDTDEELLTDFVEEASEHLEEMESALLHLEQASDHPDLLNDIFRCVHTIKGSADYIGLPGVTDLSHRMESLLDHLRQGHRPVDAEVMDVLITAGDHLRSMISELVTSGPSGATLPPSEDLLVRLAAACESVDADDALLTEQPASSETLADTFSDTIDLPMAPVNYVEENDQELLDIFLQQLHDGIASLISHASQSDYVDAEMLTDCRTQLESLNSSANYMGYSELLLVYAEWETHLDKMSADLETAVAMSSATWLADSVLPLVKSIAGFFPQASDLPNLWEGLELPEMETPLVTTDTDTPPEEDAASSPVNSDLLDQLGSAFDAMLQAHPLVEANLPEGIEGELFSSYTEASEDDDFKFAAVNSDDLTDTADGISDEDESPFSQLFDEKAVPTEDVAGDNLAGIDAVQAAASDAKSSLVTERDLLSSADSTQPPSEAAEPVKAPSAETTETKKTAVPPAVETPQQSKVARRMLSQSIRVDAGKIDALMNQVGELVVNRAFFSQLCNEMRELQHYLKQGKLLDKREFKQVSGLTFRISEATVALGRVANELQEGVMRVRMLPIAQLFSRYPRLVHDLARSSGKKVELQLRGEDTELDKMVIERIADPLVHIIRNAVDHGLETTAERLRKGKPETGVLSLNAYHESNHVVIEIEDDGSGVDLERIKAKAVEKGLIGESAATQLSEKEIINLILIPGFSTADKITHTSGRGVGMDVVKKNIEKLNGTLEVDTAAGKSTRIRIKIPLTLAIIPALLVRVMNELFTIPLSAVDETLRVFKEEISVIEGVDVMYLRDETIPLIRLREIFGMDKDYENPDKFFVVIVKTSQRRVGLIVDNMLGQEEVVIKPLEDYLQENSGFSGATILGDGQISLILDVYELIKLSTHKQARRQVI